MTKLYEKLLLLWLAARRGWIVLDEAAVRDVVAWLPVERRRVLHRLRKRSPDLLRRTRREFDALSGRLSGGVK